jgi:acylphosphatase
MIKHLDITVRGKVQGVGYRQATKAVANQLGVNGTVKNEKDGSVTIEAEADDTLLDLFLDFCRDGAETAHVTSLESHEGELKNYRNFEVLKRGLF